MPRTRTWSARLAAITLAAAALLPSPAAAQFDGLMRYGKDRVNDFTDIFRIRAGVPHRANGYGVKARATALAQVGYVHFNGTYAGMDRRAMGLARERRTEGGLSVFYASQHRMSRVSGNEFLSVDTPWASAADRRILLNRPYWDDGRGDFLGVGAEVATPILALDLGVYPSQAVDFLTGFFTIDLYDDDKLFWNDRIQEDPLPSEWGVNPEAAAAAKNAEIDAHRARIAEEQMKAEGQLGETEAAPAPPAVPAAPSAPAPDPAGEKLTREDLERIDAAAQEQTFVPVPEAAPADEPVVPEGREEK